LDQAREKGTENLIQANRRLTLLTRIANGFLLADAPQGNLKAAFDAVGTEIGAAFYFNYQIDDHAPNSLLLKLSGGLDHSEEHVFRQIDIKNSLAGRVVNMRDSVSIENMHLRDDEVTAAMRALGVRAYFAHPLIAHAHLFGTIAFASIEKTQFTESDIELVRTLADQCAAVLDRSRLVENLRESEARYRIALSAGRIATWETDFLSGTRIWSDEGMALFGLALANGRGYVGGETDEYASAMHPDDRHLAQQYHDLADRQDSFPTEYRVVRPDGSILWLAGHGHVASRALNGKAHRLISIMVDITERKKFENHIQFLMREMSHRSKNLLSVIQAIAGQTVRTAGTLEEFETRFILRLRGLAASHDVLVDQSWHGAPLADLVRFHLAPFVEDNNSRLLLSGPNVIVTAQAAQAIGLAFNELATNAAKYGSLSTPTGRVKINWGFERNGGNQPSLRLNWAEEGGPVVSMPSTTGFGYVVIDRMVANSLAGAVEMNFAPGGLLWSLSIPPANIVSGM
jgi:PAS domain S-box-containing protein